MKASILAVGSELLGTEQLDTNSLQLTERLERFGWELMRKSVVGDDEKAIAREVEASLELADLVLVTGGLGPTADDVTREGVALALGRNSFIDERQVSRIQELFERFGRDMPKVNRRQAMIIEGAVALENRWGTAPGMRIEEGKATIFLFPGVPRELSGMVRLHLEPWFERSWSEDRLRVERRVLKVACLPESTVEEKLAPAYGRWDRQQISVLASPGEIRVVMHARGTAAECETQLDGMSSQIEELLGEAVFARSEEETLESVVASLAIRAGWTLATAESCTGGMIAERCTRVAGSSGFFIGGVVAYSNRMKSELLGVGTEVLANYGAVSRETAVAMAGGARRRLGSDYAIAVTGIAGPSGGNDEKPVGTVHLALAGPDDESLIHRHVVFPGGRTRVRLQTAQLGLDLVRRSMREHQLAAGGVESGCAPGATP